MSDTFSKIEVISGIARRRDFTTEQKLAIVAESMQPGMSISYVARQPVSSADIPPWDRPQADGLSPSMVFRWRRLMSEGGREAVRADDEVVPAAEARRLEERVRDLERLLGKKTLEIEILKGGAAERTHRDRAVQLCAEGRFPMKAVTGTLGVARSNVIERVKRARARRSTQVRDGDLELAAEIRRLVDERPTCGYRRITALLRRERSDGTTMVNHKRVYRLMKKHGLRLALHTGRRRQQAHDGKVVTVRSNTRPRRSPDRRPCSKRIIRLLPDDGAPMRWSSPAGTARSSGSPSPWTAMIAR